MPRDVSDMAERAGFVLPVTISDGIEAKLERMACTTLDFDSKVSHLLLHTRAAILKATADVCTFRFPVNERIYSATVRPVNGTIHITNWGEPPLAELSEGSSVEEISPTPPCAKT